MGVTPIQLRDGRWYKRDDLYGGSGSTSGAKLRACEHLIDAAIARGTRTIATAASVLSPQHAIVANVCAARGITSHHIVGATNDESMARHPSVATALAAGAIFHHVGCADNASLQKAAEKLAANIGGEVLHRAIAPADTASRAEVRAFAEVGGREVANLPAEVSTLVIPFGSGNSAVGILTGLDMLNRSDVAVRLIGLGPSRLDWMRARLRDIGVALPAVVEHIDLHGTGYAKYEDRMPESRDGIVFHPAYEGKVVRYLDVEAPAWWADRDGTTCMWVIGSPDAAKGGQAPR